MVALDSPPPVEPIAAGDAAPQVLAERRAIARMVEHRLDGLGKSVVPKLAPESIWVPFRATFLSRSSSGSSHPAH
jgi:hypothetical protein